MAQGMGMQDYSNLPVYDTSGKKLGTAGQVQGKQNESAAPQYSGNPTTTFSAITALDQLLKTLADGGTPDQKFMTEARTQEVSRAREQQKGFSKDAAMSDAQALVNKAIADALEAANPQITAFSEGAGTSKSTTAALLTQKAALKGATEGAAQGAQLTTAYGQLSNQLEGILDSLTKQDPNSPVSQLLQAIIGSKGIVEPVRPIVTSGGSAGKQQVAPPSAEAPLVTAPSPFINNGPYLGYSPTAAQQAPQGSGTGGGIIVTHEPDVLGADTILNSGTDFPFNGQEMEF